MGGVSDVTYAQPMERLFADIHGFDVFACVMLILAIPESSTLLLTGQKIQSVTDIASNQRKSGEK